MYLQMWLKQIKESAPARSRTKGRHPSRIQVHTQVSGERPLRDMQRACIDVHTQRSDAVVGDAVGSVKK